MFINFKWDSNLEVKLNTNNSVKNQDKDTKVEPEDGSQAEEQEEEVNIEDIWRPHPPTRCFVFFIFYFL